MRVIKTLQMSGITFLMKILQASVPEGAQAFIFEQMFGLKMHKSDWRRTLRGVPTISDGSVNLM